MENTVYNCHAPNNEKVLLRKSRVAFAHTFLYHRRNPFLAMRKPW